MLSMGSRVKGFSVDMNGLKSLKGMEGLSEGLDKLLAKLEMLANDDDEDEMEIPLSDGKVVTPELIALFDNFEAELDEAKLALDRESEDWHKAFERKADDLQAKFKKKNRAVWQTVYKELDLGKEFDDGRHFRYKMREGTIVEVVKKTISDEEAPIDFSKKS